MSHSLFVSIVQAKRQIAALWQLEFDFLIDNCTDLKLWTWIWNQRLRLRLRLGWDWDWAWPTSVPNGAILKFTLLRVECKSTSTTNSIMPKHTEGETGQESEFADRETARPKKLTTKILQNYCQNCLAINSDKYQSVTPPFSAIRQCQSKKRQKLNENWQSERRATAATTTASTTTAATTMGNCRGMAIIYTHIYIHIGTYIPKI